MPALPTLNISDQTIYNRLVAAFNSSPAEYKSWLKQALRDEVISRETRTILAAAESQANARMDELRNITDSAT